MLGNEKYVFNFGSPYCGLIVKGLPYYVPPTGLPGCPTYDLAKAKSLLYQSGEYNTSVKIPIVVPTVDDTDFLAAQVLSSALAFIDSNIVMTPVSITFHNSTGYSTPGANPMPIYFLGWIADYPYPSDYTDAMYLEKGTYPGPNGWDQTYLNGLAAAHPTEAALYRAQASAFANLTANITAADTATSAATAAADYAVSSNGVSCCTCTCTRTRLRASGLRVRSFTHTTTIGASRRTRRSAQAPIQPSSGGLRGNLFLPLSFGLSGATPVKLWVYVLRRLILLVPTLIGLTLLVFALEHAGGPSVFLALYINPHLTGSARQQLVDQLTARFHLNDPIYVQYFYWLGAILQGDWGTSAQNGQAVTT